MSENTSIIVKLKDKILSSYEPFVLISYKNESVKTKIKIHIEDTDDSYKNKTIIINFISNEYNFIFGVHGIYIYK